MRTRLGEIKEYAAKQRAILPESMQKMIPKSKQKIPVEISKNLQKLIYQLELLSINKQ